MFDAVDTAAMLTTPRDTSRDAELGTPPAPEAATYMGASQVARELAVNLSAARLARADAAEECINARGSARKLARARLEMARHVEWALNSLINGQLSAAEIFADFTWYAHHGIATMQGVTKFGCAYSEPALAETFELWANILTYVMRGMPYGHSAVRYSYHGAFWR